MAGWDLKFGGDKKFGNLKYNNYTETKIFKIKNH